MKAFIRLVKGRGYIHIVKISVLAVTLCLLAEIFFFLGTSAVLENLLIPRTTEPPTKQTTEFHKPITEIANIQTADYDEDGLPFYRHEKLLPSRDNLTYILALKEWASPDDVIVLAFVDDGVLDMAYNLIETSLLKHSIHNVLFISSSVSTCHSLESHGFPCLMFRPQISAKAYSKFNSLDFIEKMKSRAHFILDVLDKHYSILLTDVDVVYLKNPFIYLNSLTNFDIAPLEDTIGSTLNAGFLFIRPTAGSKELYSRMNRIADRTPELGEQVRFNLAIKKMKSSFTNTTIKVSVLPADKFQSGKTFWELGRRYFNSDNPCNDCIVVHDNFVIGHEAKVWRLKEMGLWMFDGYGYYSSAEHRYLVYYNPQWFGTAQLTTKMEIQAIKNALCLGMILKRTVIMPKCHGSDEHSLVTLQNIVKIDPVHQNIRSMIRENSFMVHPKVPDSVKRSSIVTIDSETGILSDSGFDVKLEGQFKDGLNEGAILKLKSISNPVMAFSSMYSVNTCKYMRDVPQDAVASIERDIVPYINT